MLVHSNSKGSALVRGVCHPSVLHTVQNDKGLVDGLAGGMWTQHCGGIQGLWWRTFRRRYDFFSSIFRVSFSFVCVWPFSPRNICTLYCIFFGVVVEIYVWQRREQANYHRPVFFIPLFWTLNPFKEYLFFLLYILWGGCGGMYGRGEG